MTSPFNSIHPDVVDQVLPRRRALRSLGMGGAGVALGTLGALAMADRALAQTGQSVTSVLNFALTLEYLEESFYSQALDMNGFLPGNAQAYVAQIQKHELAHVELLRGAIGAEAVEFDDDDFDFTAGGALNPFGDYGNGQFLALAQGFEDTGVRAYKGQAPALIDNPDTLTTALQIHSVEARHASYVRRLRGEKGWVEGDGLQGLPSGFGFEAIYAGEASTSQGGVNVTTVSNVSAAAIQESFDEPLTMQAVLEIADAFVGGDVDGDGEED
ncbi:MAG: hypothetical protein Rubg2KO_26980 [Rubricoccaceae bacterium]